MTLKKLGISISSFLQFFQNLHFGPHISQNFQTDPKIFSKNYNLTPKFTKNYKVTPQIFPKLKIDPSNFINLQIDHYFSIFKVHPKIITMKSFITLPKQI